MTITNPERSSDSIPSDAGRHRTPAWLWLVTAGLFVLAIVLQRPAPPEVVPADRVPLPGVVDSGVLGAKLMLGVQKVSPASPQTTDQLRMIADATTTGGMFGVAPAWQDQIRGAIVVALTLGPDDAERTLSALEDEIAQKIADAPEEVADSPRAVRAGKLLTDVRTTRSLISRLESGAGSAGQADLDALQEHHGWFARLLVEAVDAGGSGAAGTPLRDKAASDGVVLIFLLAGFGFGIVLAIFAGFVLFVVGVVLAGSGKIRPRFVGGPWMRRRQRPFADGLDARVWLETCCVFIALFLGVKLVGTVVASMVLAGSSGGAPPAWLTPLSMGLQWLTLPAIFWPMLRGMPARVWREQIGLSMPRGVFREVGSGVLGLLAFVPVYVMLALVVVIVMLIGSAAGGLWGAGGGGGDVPYFTDPAPLPTNPLLEMVSRADVLTIFMLLTLAVVWAPLVEECIFRGALYRHMRSRLGFLCAGLITAGLFAALHGYMMAQLVLVGSLGLAFALMREWRGSIVPTIAAHAVFNGTVLALLVLVATYASV